MPAALGPLDRAAHLRKDLDFLEAQLGKPETLLVPVHHDLHPLRDGHLVVGTVRDAGAWLDAQGELVWLGRVGDTACFGIDISAVPASHATLLGTEPADLRLAAARLSVDEIEVAYQARALLGWHARHGHCSVCGERSRPRDGGYSRVCARAACGAEHFPRVDPCVLVLVTDETEIRCLLGRQAGWPAGMYSTLAGFVEPGETVEQAVTREVLEETGVQVEHARYLGSQPWPFPSSLMLGFRAVTRGQQLQLDAELQDARWFSRDELRALPAPLFVPGPHTLAGRLISAFLAE